MKTLALRKLHKWVALLVGAQVLLWVLSGTVFAWLDHHGVEGEGLAAPPPAQPLSREEAVVDPAQVLSASGNAVRALTLQRVGDVWAYRIDAGDGEVELRRASDGAPLRIDASLARTLAAAHYRGTGRLVAVRFHAQPTLETRGSGATWEAAYDDAAGTRLYFDAVDARFVSARTDAWRAKDFFWMLHTMDYRGRDDFNHPLVVLAAAAALWVGCTGLWLAWRVFRKPA